MMHKTFNINFNLSRDISRSENPEEETFYDPEHIHSEIVNWLEDLDFTVKDMKVEEIQQGTVYTGDAPSTEASFYKKNKVNSATVIDLVVDILIEAKKYIPLSPKFAMKAYDKIDEAIQELKDHLTTVQTEDLDNQSYSEGEEYGNE